MQLHRTRLIACAFVWAFLAAWVGQFRDYLPIADDFPFAKEFERGLWDWIFSSYAVTGIRRSFGLLVQAPPCAAPVEITNTICLTLHLTATVFVFDVARMLSRIPRLAFAVAVLFGIFPFGYGAVTWACGSYIIPCLIFFLAALALLLRHADRPLGQDCVMAVVSGGLVFMGCIVGEHLVFASALVGALALASTGRALCFQDLKKPWVVAPALAVGLYLVLVLATQSFHETKNITCGEGGALLINDERFIERAEIIREKGTNRSRFFRGQVDKYSWVDLGSSYLLSDVLAAFLYGQLEVWPTIQARRRAIWDTYNTGLADWAERTGVRLPVVPTHCEQAYHMFYLLLPSLAVRTALIAHLKALEILAVFHYLPLHLSDYARRWSGKPGDCPVSEDVSDRLLRLPFFNSLSAEEQTQVVVAVREF